VDVWCKDLHVNLEKGLVADSLSQKNKVLIISGPTNILKQSMKDAKIVEMLEAIEYGITKKQEIPPSIQKNSAGDSLFYIYPNQKGDVTLIGFSKQQVIIQMDKPLIK
jgi:hypothetical protein